MRTRSLLAQRIALGCFAGAVLYASASHAAPIGWIDGGYWANGQFNVSGWACDPGSARSVWVSLTAPGGGQGRASFRANAWSEPAVAAACRAPGATYLRFNIPLAAAMEESVVGQPIQVRATSNFYPWTIMSIGNSGTFRYPDNTIRGYVDNASYDGSQVVLVGWACAGGIAQSVNVHAYVGGPAGSGSWFTAATANQPSEPAVAGACGVGYGADPVRNAAPLRAEGMMQLGGLKIYVHGISPVGGSNRLLANSGLFPLPGQRATVSGDFRYVSAVW